MKLIIILVVLFSSISAYSQRAEIVEIVPLSEIMPVIVVQQESPIKVDDFIVTRNQDRNVETLYQVHNRSNKSIKSYTIARWYSDNSGYVGQGALPENGAFLEPNQSIGNTSKTKMINSTNKSTVNRNLKVIAFIMIIEVVFSDGTVFSAKNDFDLLEKHLNLFSPIYDKTVN